MILIINTSDNLGFTVALAKKNGFLVYKKNIKGQYNQAERLLPELALAMKKTGLKFQDLTGLAVVRGPGGFTSLRIGINTANTLAYALNIPAVGFLTREFNNLSQLAAKSAAKLKLIKKNIIISPFYGSQPNITKSKKKLY